MAAAVVPGETPLGAPSKRAGSPTRRADNARRRFQCAGVGCGSTTVLGHRPNPTQGEGASQPWCGKPGIGLSGRQWRKCLNPVVTSAMP